MAAGTSGAGMVTMEKARELLAQAIGSAPDAEMLSELIKHGYLLGEQQGSETLISEDSLKSFLDQLQKIENEREARLALRAVDIWRRDNNQRAVAVTLASHNAVVTCEQLSEDNEEALLDAAVKATLAAINESIGKSLDLQLAQVKMHSLPNVDQSLVAVLVTAGDHIEGKSLSGVAMAKTSQYEAAARATLNALNRTIGPFVPASNSWRDKLKKILPI
jgi:hypothetical protein